MNVLDDMVTNGPLTNNKSRTNTCLDNLPNCMSTCVFVQHSTLMI